MHAADALLAAVLADPHDDFPRLVYADYLDDRGDELDAARAEFIRTQVALADPGLGRAGRTPLEARERTLLALHASAWLKPLRARGEPLQNPGTHGLFRRGFVELVWMPAAIYLTKAGKLVQRTPAREVRFTRVKVDDLARVLAHPATRRLEALDFSEHHMGDGLAEAVAAAESLSLSVLRLRASNLTDAGAERLSDCGPGWRPRLLDVSDNPLGDRGRSALVRRFGGAVVAG